MLFQIFLRRMTSGNAILYQSVYEEKIHKFQPVKITLTGSIPSSIATLQNVTKITLNHNQFKGTIPEEIANLTNIG